MMELDSYVDRYSGETRLRRLISIAQRGPPENKKEALDLAEHQMKRDGNLQLYRRIFCSGGNNNVQGNIVDRDLLEGRPPVDVDWMNELEASNREKRHVLEGRLSTAQSRLHKDAIRAAYLALAEHDIRTGRDMEVMPLHLATANKGEAGKLDESKHVQQNYSFANINGSLFRAMDFSTSKLQTAQIGLLIIESALNAGNFVVVREYADRVESTMRSFRTSVNTSSTNTNNEGRAAQNVIVKVQIAKGIERMVMNDYKTAANTLVSLVMEGYGDVSSDYSSCEKDTQVLHWPGVTCPEDIALYAGLLCLLTRDRARMMALIDDPEALALAPAVKQLLTYYTRCQYEPFMQSIHSTKIKTEKSTSEISSPLPLLPMGCAVDAYLTQERWDALMNVIRENCIIDYLKPYERVELERLKHLFFPGSEKSHATESNTVDDGLNDVIDTVLDLMDRNLLPSTTRMDCREKIIFQVSSLEHPSSAISSMEERILDDAHGMLVRLACIEHNLVANDPSSRHGGRSRDRKGSDRGAQRQHKSQGENVGMMMLDSDDDDDDEEEVGVCFEALAGNHQEVDGDQHMVDAPSDMNPEDLY